MDHAKIHKSRAGNSKKAPRRISFKISMPIVLVLLALIPLSLWLTIRSGNSTMAAAYLAKLSAAPKVNPANSDAREHSSNFFGFLEFDWDPNAPDGVPGFDPWPRSSK